MSKNLTLTGMMGVGKSTIGKKLAKKLIDDGVPVFHKEAQSLIHGFIRCRDQSPLGNRIFKEIVKLLKSFH